MYSDGGGNREYRVTANTAATARAQRGIPWRLILGYAIAIITYAMRILSNTLSAAYYRSS